MSQNVMGKCDFCNKHKPDAKNINFENISTDVNKEYSATIIVWSKENK